MKGEKSRFWEINCRTRDALTLAPENDFFIRKAIGWALRDYARVQPEIIRHFLKSHESRLSRLTVREAGKHL